MLNKIYEKIKSFIVENYKFLIVLVIVVCLFKIELPYVIYKAGGSINLNERIEIQGGYHPKGSLEMAYVSLIKGNIPFLALAKILPDWDISSKNDIAEDNESVSEALERDKIYLEEAMDNATIAAYNLAGKDIKITETINNVFYITKEAKTDLKVYDQIISVEDTKISSLEDIKEIVGSKKEGDKITFKILRNGKEIMASATIYNSKEGLKAGISIINTYEYETNPKLSIKTKPSESGPSGGLMMALSIYNALTEEDLTNGKKIVGTGTITSDGVVGEIGGVKYKLMGAVKNKADIFLCPKENYKEAIKVAKEKKYTIKIVEVATLEDAINYLKKSSQ